MNDDHDNAQTDAEVYERYTRPRTPRGRCRRCGKKIALKGNGTLRSHTDPNRGYGKRCFGSYTLPVEENS